jgi:hypothetical protein
MEKKMRDEAQKSGVHLIEKTQKVKLERARVKGDLTICGDAGPLTGKHVAS